MRMLRSVLCALMFLSATMAIRAVEMISVRTEDTGTALVNPNMGWTMHFYSNVPGNYGSKLEPSDTLDDFPGVSTVYLRLPWAFLEPEEGKYNWAILDTPAQRWIAKGKRIALRFTCSENWMKYATPEWVNTAGARGCEAIAALVRGSAPRVRRIVLPVGTGTTLAGLVAGLDDGYQVLGVAALKGATDLEQRVEHALSRLAVTGIAQWHIVHDYHCGGFARCNPPLREFMLDFENIHGIPLDPVYTGKMLFGIHQLLQRGEWSPAVPVLAIHTGGLRGRRGYPWLSAV